MILFTIALPIEAKIIKQEIKNLALKSWKIDTLITWVWVLNTIYAIKDYIDKNGKPDFIVNIWVCGKKDDSKNDFFQVYRIKNLSNNKEALCPIYIKNLPLESLACSDKIITNSSEMWDEHFVDMESFWIDFICDKEKIPYIIIKKPFDIVSKDSLQVSKDELEKSLQWFPYENLINQIENFLFQNKKESFENSIQKLKDSYRLTFSETQILKTHINKNIAFWEKENSIIEWLAQLSQKDLLEKIKK